MIELTEEMDVFCSAWLEKMQRSEENKLEESRLLEVPYIFALYLVSYSNNNQL